MFLLVTLTPFVHSQVVWETFKKVVNETLEKTHVSASQVKAIGITTQRASFLLWNKYVPLCLSLAMALNS